MIGAGIVGAATAFFLTRAGWRVRLLDAVAPAAGATGAAAGAVSVASKRPGLMMAMARRGAALYRELAAEGVLAGAFRERPTFLVATGAAELAVLESHAAALAAAGVPVTHLDGDTLLRRLPGVVTQAAVEAGEEGHAIGFQVVHRLIAHAGLRVERNTPVLALDLAPGGSRVAGVRLDSGLAAADAVIVAAGGGAAALLGLDGAFRPRKGQQLVTERNALLCAALPGSIMSSSYLLSKRDPGPASGGNGSGAAARGYGVVIDPLETGQLLIGSTREENATRGNDIEAVAHLARAAAAVLPGLGRLRLLRSFAGVRTATGDGLPIIGRMPGVENLFVAAGFEGDGICLGPLTGRLIQRLVCGAAPESKLAVFDPARFGTGRIAA